MAAESEASALNNNRKAAKGRERYPEGLPPKPHNRAETKVGAQSTALRNRSGFPDSQFRTRH